MKNRIGGISVWRIVMGMCLLLAVGDAMAEVNPSRISFYGRNYAGRVLNANVARQTNWYMSYDVAVGFSTRSDSSVYAYKYGYPTWGVGIAVSQLSTLQFSSPSFMPDIYTVYGSFHRQLGQRGRYTWGYYWETGITSSPHHYDPVGNPDNLVQSSFIMAERMAGMAANTFNLSYTGRANMGDAEQYIESIHPYMSGSKGVCIQMMSIGDVITVDFLQSFGSSMYVDAFCKQCRELGLKFTGSQAIPFSTPRDRIRNKSVMKLLGKVLKGGQTKDKEC